MNLARFEEPKSLASVLDDVFADRFMPSFYGNGDHVSFPVDVLESKDGYTIIAELPGLNKSDLTVELKDGILTISGEKKNGTKEDKEGNHYRERRWGHFSRAFRLGNDMDPQKIEAEYKDGILTLHLRKREEAKPRNLDINWK